MEEHVEGELEEQVEGELEEQVEDELEEHVEDELEEHVEGELEEHVEDELEEHVEGELEEQVEGELEEKVEGELEKRVEEELEGQFEEELDGELEEELEGEFEEDLEGEHEEDLEDEFEEDLEDEFEEDLESEFEQEQEGEFEHEHEDEFEEVLEEGEFQETDEAQIFEPEDPEFDDDAQVESELEYEDSIDMLKISEQIEDDLEQELLITTISEDEKALSNFWLVLGDETELANLQSQGFSISNRRQLSGLDLIMARIQGPKTFDMAQNNLMVLNNTGVMADFNHVYSIASDEEAPVDAGDMPATPSESNQIMPSDLLPLASEPSSHNLGIIDTAINLDHSSLQTADIHYLELSTPSNRDLFQHGTAVASILVGDGNEYRGLRPGDPLWAVSVFFNHKKEGAITTTEFLIRAMDWLVKNQVSVINMSLSGPANRLLEKVINSLCDKGITIVAAVGNDGPNAKPQYPAAYDCTLAVTAINKKHRIFRNAVRGQHVDVAAYGVNLMHANNVGGLSSSSGTSFAAPLVSAYVAAHAPGKIKDQSQWLETFYQRCLDLGQPGWDPVYGHGLMPDKPFTVALENAD